MSLLDRLHGKKGKKKIKIAETNENIWYQHGETIVMWDKKTNRPIAAVDKTGREIASTR